MDIKVIKTGFISSNCYLLKAADSFILIDSGPSSGRRRIGRELTNAGCMPGMLGLVILTHGDFDHTGNCSYLREKYGTKTAMHEADFDMVKYGDMFANRGRGNKVLKKIVNLLFAIKRFNPDIALSDGFDLTGYGLDAVVLHIPGHTKGSVGILTGEGDFFCGDLLYNNAKPELNRLIDNENEAKESLERIMKLEIKIVYPGHGRSFDIKDLEM